MAELITSENWLLQAGFKTRRGLREPAEYFISSGESYGALPLLEKYVPKPWTNPRANQILEQTYQRLGISTVEEGRTPAGLVQYQARRQTDAGPTVASFTVPRSLTSHDFSESMVATQMLEFGQVLNPDWAIYLRAIAVLLPVPQDFIAELLTVYGFDGHQGLFSFETWGQILAEEHALLVTDTVELEAAMASGNSNISHRPFTVIGVS